VGFTLLPIAPIIELNGRALDRTVGAENAAITSFWPQHGSAVRAFVEVQAGIGRHHLDRSETAMWTGEDGFKDGWWMHFCLTLVFPEGLPIASLIL